MNDSDENSLTLTRDNFVNVLRLNKVLSHVPDRERVTVLYAVVLEFLRSTGSLSAVESFSGTLDLAFRIPGSAVHFRLSGLLRDSLTDLVTAYLLIEKIAPGRHELVLAGLVKTVMEHLSRLRTELGERCVVESMGEIAPPTTENICLNLLNNICRYPKASCQFMDRDSICTIQLSVTKETLESLEARKLVRKIRTIEPQEWTVTV
jgi:hypothetical protein